MASSSSSSSSSSAAAASSSNAIAIPRRKNKLQQHNPRHSMDSVTSNHFGYGSYGSPGSISAGSTPQGSPGSERSGRRTSLMSATFSRAEHTVINVGDSESPRLITCVKASQGFDWNQEIFLPSYADYQFDDLETRKDPVEDIILTDEEAEKMFPS
ncbi:hypothetical protein T440DRAFT_472851 [Plenodomus tracheiphilus IPT5]|uniref:Uncharacterized protein n=1 Tax=Plenodomus tracheiphilus IPT5 TaxID=1408161 RepID=A0A6A7API5_9PLEO|nr:hypothetical protein T440DRAFT_472851 [Plenodomus tracheiphilus IPT5]